MVFGEEGDRQCSGVIVVHDWRVVEAAGEPIPLAQASCDVEHHHFLLPVAKLGEEALLAFKEACGGAYAQAA
ncbi:MAG TPA: hypothetical protein VLF40_01895 [Candidatus Saccharimonadales bacterium]|nr:hypothetical protein [Candidatus Saccharimonadales bacterium]